MIPDSIIIFSAGVMPTEEGRWRTTTYEESDAFGTLGGRDRVEAAALLARQYPDAYLVTTSHRLGCIKPSLAEIYAAELHTLGVAQERIVREERSSTTQTAVDAALRLAQERGWKQLLFLSSEYHIPRIEAFYEQAKSDIVAAVISSESVLIKNDPAFVGVFGNIRKSPEYQKRLATEQRGIEAIKQGTYQPAPLEDKKERSV